nr:hypothetical protein [Tanacetum cinerariifolium]
MEGGQTVEEVFRDFKGRRTCIIKALTIEKDNLCLYGFPSEQWEVNLPAEEVPLELPEPALGINFVRDGMQRKNWLALVADHTHPPLNTRQTTATTNPSQINSVSQPQAVKYGKVEEEEEEEVEEEEEYDGDASCGFCGEYYDSVQFWICCDLCEMCFHGKCVRITPAKAKTITHYKCPICNGHKRPRH